MTSTARSIPMYPEAPTPEIKVGRGSKGYTKLDHERDMPVLQSLPAALWPTAMFLLMHRSLRPVTLAEAQVFNGKREAQTKNDLATLRQLGHAVNVSGQWAWADSMSGRALKSQENAQETSQKNVQKTGPDAEKNTVLDSESDTANKVNQIEQREQRKTCCSSVTELDRGAEVPDEPKRSYPEALALVRQAGLQEHWRQWIELNSLKFVTQKLQIERWAEWIDEGRADALRAEAHRIVETGSFDLPFPVLVAAMKRNAEEVQKSAAAHARVQAAQRGAVCQPGERRVAPDGRVWTVEVVEHGVVFFAEPNAPLDWFDRDVAKWEVAQ